MPRAVGRLDGLLQLREVGEDLAHRGADSVDPREVDDLVAVDTSDANIAVTGVEARELHAFSSFSAAACSEGSLPQTCSPYGVIWKLTNRHLPSAPRCAT